MAEQNESEQEFNPKHRIVGAIILVALAVIFLPLILEERPPEKPSAEVSEIPVPDSKIVVTPVPPPAPVSPPPPGEALPPGMTPVPAPAARKPSVPAPPETAEQARVIPEPAPAAAEKPAVRAEPKPAARPAPTPGAKTAARVEKGWVVQVGAFSNPDNARRLEARLKAIGYDVDLENLNQAKGGTVRVRVGPYREDAEAKAALARIQRELGIRGVMLAYP